MIPVRQPALTCISKFKLKIWLCWSLWCQYRKRDAHSLFLYQTEHWQGTQDTALGPGLAFEVPMVQHSCWSLIIIMLIHLRNITDFRIKYQPWIHGQNLYFPAPQGELPTHVFSSWKSEIIRKGFYRIRFWEIKTNSTLTESQLSGLQEKLQFHWQQLRLLRLQNHMEAESFYYKLLKNITCCFCLALM